MFANTGKELEHLYHILYEGDRAGVKGTNIEKYYDDFKDVKIIPFKAIKEVMGISSRSFNNAISEHITSKKKRIFEPHEFIDNPPSRSDEYNYRTMLKMNWLINDIKEVGLREPITGVVSPFFCNNKIEYKFKYHLLIKLKTNQKMNKFIIASLLGALASATSVVPAGSAQ